jgi:hypothetical protein
VQNIVKFYFFSKIKGLNSGKNNSISSKHKLELELISTKQYTKFQSYTIAAKMAVENMENWKIL